MFLIDLHLTHLNVVLLVLFDVQRASEPVYICLSCSFSSLKLRKIYFAKSKLSQILHRPSPPPPPGLDQTWVESDKELRKLHWALKLTTLPYTSPRGIRAQSLPLGDCDQQHKYREQLLSQANFPAWPFSYGTDIQLQLATTDLKRPFPYDSFIQASVGRVE